MRKYLLAAIMAASALVPAAAFAQDHREWRGRGDGGQRPDQPRAPQAQPQVQVPPQAQARPQPQAPQGQRWQGRGTDGYNRPQFQGGRGDGRGFQGQPGARPDQQPGAQPQGQAPVQPQGGGWQGNRGDGNGRGGDGRGWQGGDRGGNRNGGRPGDGAWQGDRGNQPRPGGDRWQGTDPRRDGRPDGWQQGRGNDRPGGWQQGRGGDWNRGNGGDRRDWNRGWRSDNRYNYFAYRSSNRGIYHLPRYYAPSGWGYGYRRFGVGLTLDSILYGQNYWIEDADYYRLPPAYGPYRWVRYYNDALLVDIYTGQVVDTVYDIFW